MNCLGLTSLLRRWACVVGLAALCVASGCGGGQTGGESPIPATGGCQAAHEEFAFDAPTPLGVSAGSVLAPVLGTNTAPLLWSANTGALTLGPEQGLSEIELTASYVGGRVSWARFEREPGSDGAASGGLLSCSVDRLEVELDVRLRTAGGALDEHFTAIVGAPAADNVQLTHRIPPAELMGSLSVMAPRGINAAFVDITAVWDVFGFRGTLTGGVEMMAGDPNSSADGSVGFGFVPYAEWPPPSDEP